MSIDLYDISYERGFFVNNSKKMLEKILQNIQLTGITEKKCLKSCEINTSFLTDWKNEKIKNPSVDKIVKLAVFLKMDLYDLLLDKKAPAVCLNESEIKLLNAYNNLSDEDKARVSERAETLAELSAERAAKERVAEQPQKQIIASAADEFPNDKSEDDEQDEEFYIDLCSLPASTGTGVQLDEGYTEPMRIVHTPFADRANYAVRVSGNSMEDKYYNGDIVLAETCPDVAVGEIGIFIVNDQGYIKKRGEDRLISLNPECDDVFIQEETLCIAADAFSAKPNSSSKPHERLIRQAPHQQIQKRHRKNAAFSMPQKNILISIKNCTNFQHRLITLA